MLGYESRIKVYIICTSKVVAYKQAQDLITDTI